MLQTANRLKMITTMTEYDMSLSMVKEFNPDDILKFVNSLSPEKDLSSYYKNHPNIQRELIKNEKFAVYLSKLMKVGISDALVDSVLEDMTSRGESITDYPAARLIESVNATQKPMTTYYDYLKYFSHLPIGKKQKEVVAANLYIFRDKSDTSLSDFSNDEMELFQTPYLSESNLIPGYTIQAVFGLIARDSYLYSLVRFLFDNSIKVTLKEQHHKAIHQNSKQIYEHLIGLYEQVGKDSDIMEELIECWLINDCPLMDLEIMIKKLPAVPSENLKDVFETRSSYTNMLYGNKINSIDLTDLAPCQEDIMIYAITHKKQRFIKLVEENFDVFECIGKFSALYDNVLYSEHININDINTKNLNDFRWMRADKLCIAALESGRLYTFEEIKAFYDLPEQYISLYNRLNLAKVDARLTVLKQLSKRKLLHSISEETDIIRLAEKLSVKPFSAWHQNELSHIAGLGPQDAIDMLIRYNEIVSLIPQMKSRAEAKLVLRNIGSIGENTDLESIKKNISAIDTAWEKLIDEMDLSEEFINRHNDNIIEFLCRDGAQIAKTYFGCLGFNGKREAYKRVVKAELMGEFDKLKYYADDLQKEIDHPVSEELKSAWAENLELCKHGIEVKECDDFFSTMLLGTTPQRTCLSYVDGAYRECLLSGFDTNKKVLYAYIDGKVVARAFIRLTKGRFNSAEKRDDSEAELSFVDLENEKEQNEKPLSELNREYVSLFLERQYSAGIAPEKQQQVLDLFVELIEMKASKLGAMLVISGGYNVTKQNFTRTQYYLYISKSKAGSQYLDSLNGSNSVSDEGSYKCNSFLIKQSDINK